MQTINIDLQSLRSTKELNSNETRTRTGVLAASLLQRASVVKLFCGYIIVHSTVSDTMGIANECCHGYVALIQA